MTGDPQPKQFSEVLMIILRPGSFVMLGEHPCRVTEVTAIRANRSGHTRMAIEGTSASNAVFDIFTGDRF